MRTSTAQTTTLQRPRPTAAGPAPSPSRAASWSQRCVFLLGVTAVLAGGGWSLTLDGPAPSAGADELVVDRGLASVEQVVSAARPKHAMPGMGTDDDPVADGERRVSVDLTLRATQDEAVEYDVDRFTLDVAGAGRRAPSRSVLPGSELPPGTSLSGTLVFDVPVGATTARLSYDGGAATSVALPPEVGTDRPAQDDGAAGAAHAGSPQDEH